MIKLQFYLLLPVMFPVQITSMQERVLLSYKTSIEFAFFGDFADVRYPFQVS